MALNVSKFFRNSSFVITRSVFYRANTEPSFKKEEPVGHTGQKFGPIDRRSARFLLRDKQVNPNFAIDMVNEVEPIEIDGNHVFCDGGDPALGHPKVYINLDKPGSHTCGYCGLRYVMKHH